MPLSANPDATDEAKRAAHAQWNDLQTKANELRNELDRSSARLNTAIMSAYLRRRHVSIARLATLQEEMHVAHRRWLEAQDAAHMALLACDELNRETG